MTNGLILFYSFADGPFPVKEKQERIFFFFLLYIFFFMKENAQVQGWEEEAGWRSTVARMMTLPSSQPQPATTRIMIAEGSEYPAINGSLSDFLSESPSCMNDLCKQAGVLQGMQKQASGCWPVAFAESQARPLTASQPASQSSCPTDETLY